jgi:hypothetical protein
MGCGAISFRASGREAELRRSMSRAEPVRAGLRLEIGFERRRNLNSERGSRPHIFALTTRTRHGSAKPSALSRARIRLMPRSWLKTTTKTRRPLKSRANG